VEMIIYVGATGFVVGSSTGLG
ncbi:hypothetical protein LCGC14_2099010, partial [marine sediment metagenome]